MSLRELEICIAPAGMAATKAARIRNALEHVDREFERDFSGLASLTADEARTALLAIPGFGPKAADCFLSIGLGIPTAVVDVNVFRSFRHLFPDEEAHISDDYSDSRSVRYVRSRVQDALPDDPLLFQIVHTLLLLFSKDRFGNASAEPCVLGATCRRCRDTQSVLTT